MPKTKFQKIVFAFLTVFITVHAFTFYNISINMGSMSNQVFIESYSESFFNFPIPMILMEFICAFSLQMIFVGKYAKKLAFCVVSPKEDKPFVVSIAMTCATVAIMCPLMSLVSILLHNGFSIQLLAQWLQAILFNFPFAFFTQLFFIQPLVRFLFSNIFRKQLENDSNIIYKQNIVKV